jgi:hypothetical protein
VSIAKVLDGIACAPALPAPVPRLVGMGLHAKSIATTTPGARAGVLPTVGAGDPVQGRVAADQVEQLHGDLTPLLFRYKHHKHRDKSLDSRMKNDCVR